MATKRNGEKKRFPKVHFFLSDEGYGHIVRQEAIIKEFIRRIPNIQVSAQTQKNLRVLKEKFGDRVQYLDRYNNIHTTKTAGGSLDVQATLNTFAQYERNSEVWLKEMAKAGLDFDFAITDFVPEAFTLCKQLGKPCFGVAHFTWDWFLDKISDSAEAKRACELMETHTRNATRLYFPPFTQPEILTKYSELQREVAFIINDFAHVKMAPKEKNSEYKCLIMDNGTLTLSKVIEKSIPELAKLTSVFFYVCADNLGEKAQKEIEAASNIQAIYGLQQTHSHIPLVDFVLARGGFNTLTECLITRTPAILVEEGGNPEISGNIKMLEDLGLAGHFDITDFNQSLGPRLVRFIETEQPQIREKLLATRFENSGPAEIVEDILLTTWK